MGYRRPMHGAPGSGEDDGGGLGGAGVAARGGGEVRRVWSGRRRDERGDALGGGEKDEVCGGGRGREGVRVRTAGPMARNGGDAVPISYLRRRMRRRWRRMERWTSTETTEPMDGSDGSTRDAQVFFRFVFTSSTPTLYSIQCTAVRCTVCTDYCTVPVEYDTRVTRSPRSTLHGPTYETEVTSISLTGGC